jgi:hypothetical protein
MCSRPRWMRPTTQGIELPGLRLPELYCVPNGVGWPDEHVPLSGDPYAHITQPYALPLSRIDPKNGLDPLLAAWKWVPDLAVIILDNDGSGCWRKLE